MRMSDYWRHKEDREPCKIALDPITKDLFGRLLIDTIGNLTLNQKLAIMKIYRDGGNFVEKYEKRLYAFTKIVGKEKAELFTEILSSTENIKKQIKKIESLQCKVAAKGQMGYPKRLERFEDAPFMLYYKGSMSLLDERQVLITGTRTVSSYGKDVTTSLVKRISQTDACVLCGISDGVDTIAIETALDSKCKIVVLCPSSIYDVTPAINRKLAEDVAKSGLIVSQFPPDVQGRGFHYPVRDNLVSKIADSVILVEGSKKSNTLKVIKKMAKDENKDIYAVPGKVDSELSEAPNMLITEGIAKCLTSSRQFIEDCIYSKPPLDFSDVALQTYEPKPKKPEKEIIPIKRQINILPNEVAKSSKNVNLNEFEQSVLSLLDREPLHFDILCEKLQVPHGKLMAKLLMMETKKLIKKLPGNIYQTSR